MELLALPDGFLNERELRGLRIMADLDNCNYGCGSIDNCYGRCEEQSKSASNELLGGREAGNNNSGEGKLNSRSLGSKKCPTCLGRKGRMFNSGCATYFIQCEDCEGTGREAAL